jgi:superfamily II DNA/RNA helicase
MVAIAPTGEGKTLGFLIPMMHHLQNLPRVNATNSESGPHALVLVPSRELA